MDQRQLPTPAVIVHPNGDLTIGRRVSLTMYRPTSHGRYVPAFDFRCSVREFTGQFKPGRPAFYWRCRIRNETTSISVCRDCSVSEGQKQAYLDLVRPLTYTRPPGPPTPEDNERFAEYKARFGAEA